MIARRTEISWRITLGHGGSETGRGKQSETTLTEENTVCFPPDLRLNQWWKWWRPELQNIAHDWWLRLFFTSVSKQWFKKILSLWSGQLFCGFSKLPLKISLTSSVLVLKVMTWRFSGPVFLDFCCHFNSVMEKCQECQMDFFLLVSVPWSFIWNGKTVVCIWQLFLVSQFYPLVWRYCQEHDTACQCTVTTCRNKIGLCTCWIYLHILMIIVN